MIPTRKPGASPNLEISSLFRSVPGRDFLASGDIDGLTGLLCQAIATKLMQDGQFQEELMEMLDKDEEGGDG